MNEDTFRIVYKRPEDGEPLRNLDIGEVSLNGEPITDLVDVELDIRPTGIPVIRLTRAKDLMYPTLKHVHIDGYAKVEIVTE